MRKIATFLVFFLCINRPIFAGIYQSIGGNTDLSSNSRVITDSLWEQVGWPKETLPPAPKMIPTPVPSKKFDQLDKKTAPKIVVKPNTKKIIQKKVVPPKKESKGAAAIKAMLAKNRAKLKNLHQKQKDEEKKAALNKPKNMVQEYRANLKELKRQERQSLASWKSMQRDTLKRWVQKRKEFLKELPSIKENLFKLEAGIELPDKKLSKPLSRAPLKDFSIIPGALDLPVRKQGRRPTCAAFTAIRGIETVLNANGVDRDLSEQYFYWSSKPSCQIGPCSQRGSWVISGLNHSKNSPFPDIPLEKDCPYQAVSIPGNETQIPLGRGCKNGSVQVMNWSRLDTLDSILNALEEGSPIVGGFRLSPNFYRTDGLVTVKDALKKGKTDGHASGHALLLVGTMKLPKKYHPKEGKICFLVANSWGEGWGRGGFGCLTENWVQKYRIRNAFVSINKIRI